jgi:hypothetical protein
VSRSKETLAHSRPGTAQSVLTAEGISLLAPDECLFSVEHGTLLGASALEFWRWAFSDLRQNNIRGVFAEWMVSKFLGLATASRDSWASHDLVIPSGVRIEIKAAAYLQAWHKSDDPPSDITFSSLRGRLWDETTRAYSEKPTFNADLYVFCLNIEKHPECFNAFNLDQWRFLVLSREQISEVNQDSIRLLPLTKLCRNTWGAAWDKSVPLFYRDLLGVVQALSDPRTRRSLLLPSQSSLFPEMFT